MGISTPIAMPPPPPSTSTWGRLLFLGSLYFVQGLPFGFQTKALPVFLRARGVALAEISLLGLLALPWSLKVLWAPLVDEVYSRRLGRRKSWILPCQLLMAAAALLSAVALAAAAGEGRYLGGAEEQLPLVLGAVLVMNLAAATQDIAVDGLALALLADAEAGLGNTAQVVGFKVGMLTGGGLLSYAAEGLGVGWPGVFAGMAALVLASAAQVALFHEPPQRGEGSASNHREQEGETMPVQGPGFDPDDGQRQQQLGSHYVHPQPGRTNGRSKFLRQRLVAALGVAGRLFTSPVGRRAALLAVTYKMGEAAGDAMFKPFLVDAGVDSGTIGLWTGLYGMLFSIAGSTLGGLAARRLQLHTLLPLVGALRAGPQVARWLLARQPAIVGSHPGAVLAVVCGEALAGGMLTTCVFAAMMLAVERDSAAQFTLLATLEVVGKSAASLPAGFLAQRFGYPALFGWAALVGSREPCFRNVVCPPACACATMSASLAACAYFRGTSKGHAERCSVLLLLGLMTRSHDAG